MHASTVLTVTSATLLTGFVGYAVYFDYKRRNDPTFRSQLKKDRKRTTKELKKQNARKEREVEDTIERTVKSLNEPGALPTGVSEKEAVFMQSVQEGEILAAQGQAFYLTAASAFYKALKVYPEPVQLLVIYQKAVPEVVFKYIYEMYNKDPSTSSGAGASAFGGSLEEIDDVAPAEKASTAPVSSSSPPSAPVSSQGESSSTTNGDASSQEWEKISQPDGEAKDAKKAEEEVVSATDDRLSQIGQEALKDAEKELASKPAEGFAVQ